MGRSSWFKGASSGLAIGSVALGGYTGYHDSIQAGEEPLLAGAADQLACPERQQAHSLARARTRWSGVRSAQFSPWWVRSSVSWRVQQSVRWLGGWRLKRLSTCRMGY